MSGSPTPLSSHEPAPHEPSSRHRSSRSRVPAFLAWCVPLVLLGAVAAAVWITLARPTWLFVGLLVVLGCLPFVWMLLSALWPARAERRCPACGEEALVRLDPDSTHGLRCDACGWLDESASAWLLAEEEGPLEEIVLGERAARRGRQRGRPASPGAVDSPRSGG